MTSEEIRGRLKEFVVENLNLDGVTPEQIDDTNPLFGGELGLDSIDALELILAIEKEYGIHIKAHQVPPEVFANIATLAAFVEASLVRADAPLAGQESTE